MCLTKPGRIIEINNDNPNRIFARVNFTNVVKNISIKKTPKAKVGDYILAHMGIATSILDADDARNTLRLLWGFEE